MNARFMLTALDDQTLLERLRTIVHKSCEWTASLIAYVAEVDARQLFLGAGCSSMFDYCVSVLGLCEGSAFKTIRAARAARQFPIIFELVASGELHVSGVVVLASLLTEENHREVLEKAKRQSKRAIEELAATLAPKPDVPPTIRKLPAPKVAMPLLALASPAPKTAPSPPPQPLSEDRFKVQFTASRELRDKIATAQALLRHQIPDGELEKVFDKAIDLLLKEVAKKKLAATDKPRPSKAQPASTAPYIPAIVKRGAAARDGLRCSYVSPDGRRCNAVAFLEFDHIQARAKGGPRTLVNIRVVCRAHNQYLANQTFGADFMAEKRGGASS